MRWLILSVLLFATVAIYADDEVETEDWEDDWVDDEVLALTADNFQSFIDENEYVLVEFCKFISIVQTGHIKEFNCLDAMSINFVIYLLSIVF